MTEQLFALGKVLIFGVAPIFVVGLLGMGAFFMAYGLYITVREEMEFRSKKKGDLK